MDNCYLCGKKFNNKDVKKHDEHIIQQAIGGNLKENNILCLKCGGNLGREIDVPFNKIFEGIATRLDIKTDRNNSKSSSTKGKYVTLKYKLINLTWTEKKQKMTLFDFQYQYNQFNNEIGEIDVLWKNFKVTPVRPFHKYIGNNTKVIIYGNKKNAKKYKKRVENEISKKFENKKKPEIIICDDLEGIIEYPFNMNNKAFKKGLAKIAIGFASKYNISRDELPLALEIDRNTKQARIKDKILAIQFYPLGIIDRLIEIQKNEFDHYPFHNLILFTLDYDLNKPDGKKFLICYIELFSTFQWYVVLNDGYYGKSIYEYYAQNILKKDDYIVNINWRRYYKERNLYLDPLGITEEDIDKKYKYYKEKFFSKLKWYENTNNFRLRKQYKIKSRWSIEAELIQEEIIKQKYKLDFEGYLRNIINGISNQVLLLKHKQQFLEPELKNTHFGKFFSNKYLMSEYAIFDDFENLQNFIQNLDLFFSYYYNEEDYIDNEIFSIYSYRSIYIENGNLEYYTNLIKYFEILNKNDAFKAYGHKKMFMLEQYIQEETIKQKRKQ